MRQPLLKLIPYVLLFVLTVILTGCWDRVELEEQAFVQTIGLDQGRAGQVLVTFRIVIPSRIISGTTGSAGEASPSSFLTSLEVPTIPMALQLANTYISRPLNLIHARGLVIGEDLAKGGLREYLTFFSSWRQNRKIMFVVVAKGKAFDILQKFKPDLETNINRVWESVPNVSGATSLFPVTQLNGFISAIEGVGISPIVPLEAINPSSAGKKIDDIPFNPENAATGRSAVIAGQLPRLGGNPVEFIGGAVFKGDKLITTIAGYETRVWFMLTGKFRKALITFRDPIIRDKFIVLDIKQGSKPDVDVQITDGQVVINETISLEGDIFSVQSHQKYASDLKLQRVLETAISRDIEQRSLQFIKKIQGLNNDIFGYADFARRDFLTYPEWLAFKWHQKFANAKINLQVSFKLRRTGLLTAPVEVQN